MFKFTYGHVAIYGRTQNSWMMYTKFGMLLSKHGMGSIPNVYKCTINYHRSSGKSWKVTQGLREISILFSNKAIFWGRKTTNIFPGKKMLCQKLEYSSSGRWIIIFPSVITLGLGGVFFQIILCYKSYITVYPVDIPLTSQPRLDSLTQSSTLWRWHQRELRAWLCSNVTYVTSVFLQTLLTLLTCRIQKASKAMIAECIQDFGC